MTTFEQVATITNIERLNNSYVGNPRYAIEWQDQSGRKQEGKTKTNGAVGYRVGYSMERQNVLITYHYTTLGNLIIDDIRRTK